MTDVLFVHNNFPGQYRLLASRLAQAEGFRVVAIGSHTASDLPGVILQRYRVPPADIDAVHGFARRFDGECRRAEQVLYAASALKAAGVRPRIIFAHPGWGETLPLKQVFPDAKLCVYAEFYYRPEGADVGFDPEFARFGADGRVRIAMRNAATLLALTESDAAVAPTHWQKSLFPAEFQNRIAVIHDGVETERLVPRLAGFRHPRLKQALTVDDEVVTYVARSLEPYRGFHTFMRALPRVLRERPRAQICIVGDDGVSYGSLPDSGETWRETLLAEVGGDIDLARVHFLGTLPYARYLDLLRVSRVHVYLTYPFVLSWSLVEAMALGCLIVTSDTAPVREVIRDGENGLLAPFFDIQTIADRIIAAASDPQRFAGLRSRARASAVDAYDFERASWPQFRALISRLLGLDAGAAMPASTVSRGRRAPSPLGARPPIESAMLEAAPAPPI